MTTPFSTRSCLSDRQAHRGGKPPTKNALRILDHFDHIWAMDYRGHPRIKDDKDVTKEDFAKYNVVLFGDPGSNQCLAKMMPKLPLKWTKETITVGDNTFPASENLPVLAYPNPLSSGLHYVVLNTGLTISDGDYNGDYAMPRFGDMAVLEDQGHQNRRRSHGPPYSISSGNCHLSRTCFSLSG